MIGFIISCYADLVVGAPYDETSGAIYIFHGSLNGVYKDFSQVCACLPKSLCMIGKIMEKKYISQSLRLSG